MPTAQRQKTKTRIGKKNKVSLEVKIGRKHFILIFSSVYISRKDILKELKRKYKKRDKRQKKNIYIYA